MNWLCLFRLPQESSGGRPLNSPMASCETPTIAMGAIPISQLGFRYRSVDCGSPEVPLPFLFFFSIRVPPHHNALFRFSFIFSRQNPRRCCPSLVFSPACPETACRTCPSFSTGPTPLPVCACQPFSAVFLCSDSRRVDFPHEEGPEVFLFSSSV